MSHAEKTLRRNENETATKTANKVEIATAIVLAFCNSINAFGSTIIYKQYSTKRLYTLSSQQGEIQRPSGEIVPTLS
jgi:hypothetical protein